MSPIEPLEDRRLFATYTPDMTFGGDGALVAVMDAASAVPVRDGRIITGGHLSIEASGPRFYVSRFHADGTPDEGFGARVVAFGPEASGLTLVGADASARPFYAGSSGNTAYINRLSTAGSRDRGFAAELTPPGSQLRSVTVDQVQPLPNGKVLAVVRVISGSRVTTYLAKLGGSGLLDLSFGLNGYSVIGQTTRGDRNPPAVWVQADDWGRIYFTAGQRGVTRLRANGSRDTGFGSNGSTGDFAVNPAAALDASGRLVILDPSMNSIRRFDTSGDDDPTFGTGGQAAPVLTHLAGEPISVFPQSDGLIYAQSGKTLARFTDAGQLDTHFDSDGLARLPSAGMLLGVLPEGRFLQRDGNDVRAVARLKNVAVGSSGMLYITGESASDHVGIQTTGQAVKVTFGNETFTYKTTAVRRISANLGRGDNVFTSTAALPTTVITADGRDRITTGNANDSIYSGGGSDRIFTFGGDDLIHPGEGDNTIDGGDGTDTYIGESATDTVTGTEDDDSSISA